MFAISFGGCQPPTSVLLAFGQAVGSYYALMFQGTKLCKKETVFCRVSICKSRAADSDFSFTLDRP